MLVTEAELQFISSKSTTVTVTSQALFTASTKRGLAGLLPSLVTEAFSSERTPVALCSVHCKSEQFYCKSFSLKTQILTTEIADRMLLPGP